MRRKLFFAGIVVALLLLAALGASLSLVRGARRRLAGLRAAGRAPAAA
jgi:VIT1/CCC1 family predicted Fe2+/Mn2+ transporter